MAESCPACNLINNDSSDRKDDLVQSEAHERSMGRLSVAVIGGLIVLNSFLLKWFFPEQPVASNISAVVGAIILAFPIIWTSILNVIKGKIFVNELVSLAILSSFAGEDFRTAGIISFFLLITVIIETRTASGAQRSIEALVKLTPTKAVRIEEEGETEVDVSELELKDIIRVRPGDNFPIDGTIENGESTVNQASITGESLPVEKAVGDEVYAGTQNLTGSIKIRVTKLGEETTLGRVKEMILAAEQSKPPIVKIIDRYAAYYTPAVLMIAGITWFMTNGDMQRVITLMIIACPCAIVLATPSAMIAAVASAARLGILIKNVTHLELAAKIKSFVFDKTGTLTHGSLSVGKLKPVEGIEPAELLKISASVESHSNHPTAKALVRLAEEAGLKLDSATKFSESSGKGVKAELNGKTVIVGRAKWIEKQGIQLSREDENREKELAGMSVVYVALNQKSIGWIGFKDKLRDESEQVIRHLKEDGIQSCSMVTGDRDSVAEQVGSTLGLDKIQSECLPEDKVAYVNNEKKSTPVAVVGDGVNDAPALAAGDLGIAMGAIGSDIAVNSASIALMTNDLRRLPVLILLSKKSAVVINQNLFMSIMFVVGGMILSVFGLMQPITAAALHTIVTLIILFNSARLVRTGEELTIEEAKVQ